MVDNWLFVVGAALSFVAAIGFLTFFRGFALGLNQIVYIDGHEEHVAHARVYAVQGFIIMYQVFVVWVTIRMLGALIGYGSVNMGLGFFILFIYGLLSLWTYYKGFWTPAGGGGH